MGSFRASDRAITTGAAIAIVIATIGCGGASTPGASPVPRAASTSSTSSTSSTPSTLDAGAPSHAPDRARRDRPARAVGIASFLGTTCATLESGLVECWGPLGALGGFARVGRSGRVGVRWRTGVPDEPASFEPVPLSGISDVAKVVWDGSPCVVRRAGTIACLRVQGGPGEAEDEWVEIAGITDATDLAARAPSSLCARLRSGGTSCFTLSRASFSERWRSQLVPVPAGGVAELSRAAPAPEVPGLTDVVEVTRPTTETSPSCALRRNGEVLCWGWNHDGALGQPITLTVDQEKATAVAGIDDAVDVAATAGGWGGTCVARRDGSTWCWGVMTGIDGASGTAAPMPALAGAVHLLSGRRRILGRGKDGAVQPMDVAAGTLVPGPARLPIDASLGTPPVRGATALVVDDDHACTLERVPGPVRCWGRGEGGRLGDGAARSTAIPAPGVTVQGIVDAVRIEGAAGFVCALREKGQVLCWGERSTGDGEYRGVTYTKPTAVFPGDGFTDLAVGPASLCVRKGKAPFTCELRAKGGPAAWGPVIGPTRLTDVTRLALGRMHFCAIRGDGSVVCGGSWPVPLGDGSVLYSRIPLVVRRFGS